MTLIKRGFFNEPCHRASFTNTDMNILCYLLPYSAEETLVIELNVRVMDQATEKINEVSDSQGAQPDSQ